MGLVSQRRSPAYFKHTVLSPQGLPSPALSAGILDPWEEKEGKAMPTKKITTFFSL